MDLVSKLSTGARLTELLKIPCSKGDIYHVLKKSDNDFNGFGEVYFTTVIRGVTKGWKRHHRMTLNLVVPVGEVEFKIYNQDRNLFDCINIGPNNYYRLTVPPLLWVSFTGLNEGLNLIANVASIEHDPCESDNHSLDGFFI